MKFLSASEPFGRSCSKSIILRGSLNIIRMIQNLVWIMSVPYETVGALWSRISKFFFCQSYMCKWLAISNSIKMKMKKNLTLAKTIKFINSFVVILFTELIE